MSFWKGKTVLVTGGAGFIGSNLTERLVKEGGQVRVVDNLERGKLENLKSVIDFIEFSQEDLRDKKVCIQVCKDIEVVFHLAARVGGIGYYLKKPAEVLNHNTLVDTLMLKAVKQQKVDKYLYTSSAHVYPIEMQTKPTSPKLKEEIAIPANPALSYGWEKLLAEQQIKYTTEENPSFKSAIVRIFGAFGKKQDFNLATGSAIPVFIRRAIEYPKRKPFKVFSSGEETRSYCYITDVIEAMVKAVEKLEQTNLIEPINVGSEERITIQKLAEEIVKISGKDIEIVNEKSDSTTIWGQIPDCSKAMEVLNWSPCISLREGLERTYKAIESKLKK